MKKKYSIYKRVRSVIGVKSGVTYVICHSYAKIKEDSCICLPLKKTMIFHNVMIFIDSMENKDKNNYYYKNDIKNKFLYKI